MVRSDGNGAFIGGRCSDDLDNGKNNTGAEEDGEKVYMTVNVSTVSQGTLTKADPTPSNPNQGGAGWGEDGNGSLGELSGSKEGMVYDVNIFLVPTDEESLGGWQSAGVTKY